MCGQATRRSSSAEQFSSWASHLSSPCSTNGFCRALIFAMAGSMNPGPPTPHVFVVCSMEQYSSLPGRPSWLSQSSCPWEKQVGFVSILVSGRGPALLARFFYQLWQQDLTGKAVSKIKMDSVCFLMPSPPKASLLNSAPTTSCTRSLLVESPSHAHMQL